MGCKYQPSAAAERPKKTRGFKAALIISESKLSLRSPLCGIDADGPRHKKRSLRNLVFQRCYGELTEDVYLRGRHGECTFSVRRVSHNAKQLVTEREEINEGLPASACM